MYSFSKVSLNFRHYLVKLLAPTLYRETRHVRPMIWHVKQHLKNPMVGVEIGVAKGTNALSIFRTIHMKRLYLVDPYKPYVESGKILDYSPFFLYVKKRLNYPNVTLIRKTSVEAVGDVPNGLDFVYIDGDHSYENVEADIVAWYPKVRLGGVLGGHDYSAKYTGVCRAVNEFTEKTGLQLCGEDVDWWITKNE